MATPWRTLLGLVANRSLWRLLRLGRSTEGVYRLSFLAAAAQCGVLQCLAAGPCSCSELAARVGIPAESLEAFDSWLQVGVSVGVLRRHAARYALRGGLAKMLAQPEADGAVAMIDQSLGLHRRLIVETPNRLHSASPFRLADSDNQMIARASKLAAPFVLTAVDAAIPAQGPFRVLDVGCGAGEYLRHACRRNRSLTGVGLELQSEVAELCRQNVAGWDLSNRIEVHVGDVRHWAVQDVFDLVMMHSLIYYFPWSQRVDVLRSLRRFLNSSGRVLLTTGCHDRHVTLAVLNLWGTMTAGCGPLPTHQQMEEQLREAGYRSIIATRLVPGVNVMAFTAAV